MREKENILNLLVTNTTDQNQTVYLMSYYHIVEGTYKTLSSVEITQTNGANRGYAAYHEIVVHTSAHPLLIEEFIINSHENSVDKEITLIINGRERPEKTTNGRVKFNPPFRADNRNSIRINLDPHEKLRLQLISAD